MLTPQGSLTAARENANQTNGFAGMTKVSYVFFGTEESRFYVPFGRFHCFNMMSCLRKGKHSSLCHSSLYSYLHSHTRVHTHTDKHTCTHIQTNTRAHTYTHTFSINTPTRMQRSKTYNFSYHLTSLSRPNRCSHITHNKTVFKAT